MSHTERTQADAGVCAFLGTVDEGFEAGKELGILEDSTRIAQWQAELRRRDAIQAQESADDPIPGVNTHPIGLVGARIRQQFTNDPTVYTRQAIRNAAHGIMSPETVNFAMRSSFTGTASTPTTTGEATVATGGNATTTDDTTVYVVDMLGNISIARGTSPGSVAGTALNTDTAMSSSSSNAAATSNMINVASAASPSTPANSPNSPITAALPSSSTAAETGANGQTLPGAEGQDAGTKISKAKKKNDGRKRAKAAQAKQASEDAGTSVENDDNGDDREDSDLVNV